MEEKSSRFKRICVFCGSSPGKKSSYQEAAVQLGNELVKTDSFSPLLFMATQCLSHFLNAMETLIICCDTEFSRNPFETYLERVKSNHPRKILITMINF